MSKKRSTYPRMYQRKNGYHYIEWDRNNSESLGTKDQLQASQRFTDKVNNYWDKKVVSLEKFERITLREYMKEYLHEREIDGLSSFTTRMYDLAVRKFIEAIGNPMLRLITRKHVNEFKEKMLAIGNGKSTINGYMRSLHVAFNQAMREIPGVRKAYIDRNPFTKMHKHDRVMYKLDEALPHYLEKDELRALFRVIDDPDFLVAALIYYHAGIRRTELTKIHRKDVNFFKLHIVLRGTKGKKDETVPIFDELYAPLAYYFRKCTQASCIDSARQLSPRFKLPDIIERLINLPGKKATCFLRRAPDIGPAFPRWVAMSLTRLFKIYADKASIEAHLHCLRHTCATDLVDADVDISVIKELLRHKSLTTTEIYAKVKKERVRRAGNKLKSPFGM